MASIQPYITVPDGKCREAMEFYGKVFGAEPNFMTFGDSPMDIPEEMKGLIMHSDLTFGSTHLMACDPRPDHQTTYGNNISLSVDADSEDDQTQMFNDLSAGGMELMPLQDTFWGARFGMCVDKYGVTWMFNYDRPQN